jgi:hypothetical protein
MPTVHLRGGPGDGQVFDWPRLEDVMAHPASSPERRVNEGRIDLSMVKLVTYRRRLRRDLYPASFLRRHGGPDAGHWLFDWEKSPKVQRVKNVRILSGPTVKAGPVVVAAVHQMILSELHQYGDFDRRDLEWSARPPKLWELQAGVMAEDDVVIRCEVVIEVAS